MLNIEWFVEKLFFSCDSDYCSHIFYRVLVQELNIINLINQEKNLELNQKLTTDYNPLYDAIKAYLVQAVNFYYRIIGGSYYEKYLKYKIKYINLLKKINN